jgi:hypothetical protein
MELIMEKEIWKPIKKLGGNYSISNFGRVKSISRYVNLKNGKRKTKNRIMKIDKNNVIKVRKNNQIIRFNISRLVYEIFKGKIEDTNVIDHIDRNRANNHIKNLRQCTQRQNTYNNKSNKGNSKYKGVSWHKQRNKWGAYIHYNYRKIHLGYYTIEKEAAMAYNKKAKELFGKFAYLNEV